MEPPVVSAKVFRAVQTVNVAALSDCSEEELRPILASLVRMSLIASLDRSSSGQEARASVLRILSGIELVNNLVALLSIDFHSLENEVRNEISLRAKPGSLASDSVLISNLQVAPALEFERSDATRRLKLVLSELLLIMGQIQSMSKEEEAGSGSSSFNSFQLRSSELFDHLVYLSELCDVLAIALAELPSLLFPAEVAEALLRLKYGPEIICHVVANQPDSFRDVVNHLLRNGNKQEDDNGNRVRQRALLMLCRMNPAQILSVRSYCVELCRIPSLVILLSMEHASMNPGGMDSVVSFLCGRVVAPDSQVRSWISSYFRNSQKKQDHEPITELRRRMLDYLKGLVRHVEELQSQSQPMNQEMVIKSCALLRLYTALRGLAGLKLLEEELDGLLDLITLRAPATAAGVKFVSLGLCMLIACNSLIAATESEKKAVTWIHWLMQEESHFEEASGVTATFGKMLLLMAIHFHSNQLTAICDLICQTLGMKIVIRTSSMARIKHLFTHEVFNEQAVASHAVRVPVTPNLSANLTGFLPVHCIHQLLKSRAFSKHRVPIKVWIYRQICESKSPIHAVLPAVLEVFVNSVLIPASNRGNAQDQVNEPLSESDVWAVFRKSVPMKDTLATQVLMLYYVLLYENVRLLHMKSVVSAHRKVLKYSQELLADLPIKYLLQMAEKQKDNFNSIFPQLLKLCCTHFPHLCLVQDWLQHYQASRSSKETNAKEHLNLEQVNEALSCLASSPSLLTILMQQMMQIQDMEQLWTLSQPLVEHVKDIMLESTTTPQVQELFKDIWYEMNKIYPRQLWAKTVSHLSTVASCRLSHEDLVLDPLQVLRCDARTFRVSAILDIILYMLKACLAASRSHLQQHILENPIVDRHQNAQVTSDLEREELRNALVATQESAAIQILLEAALSDHTDITEETSGAKEVKLICSYIHEAFINDPNLAKLIHFQGYPMEFLPITVTGVPSMHICLDFAPELLRQPELEKQIFAVDLVSHLSVQYALPKSYSTARLAVNTLSTLLSVLTAEERNTLMPPVLPSLVRFSKAFPPLACDIITLLIQYGRIQMSEASLLKFSLPTKPPAEGFSPADQHLQDHIQRTFQAILHSGVLLQRLY